MVKNECIRGVIGFRYVFCLLFAACVFLTLLEQLFSLCFRAGGKMRFKYLLIFMQCCFNCEGESFFGRHSEAHTPFAWYLHHHYVLLELIWQQMRYNIPLHFVSKIRI